MVRFMAGVVSALLLVTAGIFLFRSGATTEAPPIPAPRAAAQQADVAEEEIALPAATATTREQRRFNRYDKDRDGKVAREEYLASRRKAYARLDTDGDGRLSFDEWAAKTTSKFASADADRSGTLDTKEFAATAVKRSPTRPRCPPRQPANAAD